jgi:CDP-glucose 4,6-dehydratase
MKSFDLNFYKEKKVFITGHTGFKGSWMCKVLEMAGANVMGYSLNPPTNPNLFEIANIGMKMESVIGDVRDLEKLKNNLLSFSPEIVIHMAAQPIVRESYINPVYTYETNVMGTVNILECIRLSNSVKSFVNVTTDKVYKNKEWIWGYREDEELNGFDPYSNSKSCSDIITDSYRNSFFTDCKVAISSARAGNVIGGGDFAIDRIIPDCIRAAKKNEPIIIRNPNSIRPYQHVLEPIMAYLMIAQKQYTDPKSYSGSYNIGPNEEDCIPTKKLVKLFCEKWGKLDVKVADLNKEVHEANFLKLDSTKLKTNFDWAPIWNLETAVNKTVEWEKCKIADGDIEKCMETQILDYVKERLQNNVF